jgi:hypothetical protein
MSNSDGTLTPAYGRDYRSKTALLEDFRKGLDFYFHHPIQRSGYCSIRDFKPGELVKFRYDKGRQACFYIVADVDVPRGTPKIAP